MPDTSQLTKEQLYREAKRLGINGRSKMNKGQLVAAINRRRG
jgi:Rho termination factor, N-terminal domain